jgi:hypothetical protein
MPDEDIVTEDTSNLATEEVEKIKDVEEPTTTEGTEDTGEDVEALKQKNVDLYDRAKKAEAQMRKLRDELKVKKEPVSTPSDQGSLTLKSIRELRAISDLTDEDAEYVANYAEKFNTSISAARKDKDVQAVLSVRAEERRTAEATASGNTRRGTGKVSAETLLEEAERGKIPENEADITRVIEARFKKKPQ